MYEILVKIASALAVAGVYRALGVMFERRAWLAHSRIDHSLGAYETALRLLNEIEKTAGEEVANFDEEEVKRYTKELMDALRTRLKADSPIDEEKARAQLEEMRQALG